MITSSARRSGLGCATVRSGAGDVYPYTAVRDNHARRVTYNGHPLYDVVGDSVPGQTSGERHPRFGARRDVLSAGGHKSRRVSNSSVPQVSGKRR